MKIRFITFIILFIIFITTFPAFSQTNSYPWLRKYSQSESIQNRIPAPKGYKRINTIPGTFEDWLRHLLLKKGNSPVLLYNGKKKGNQNAHYAVLDIDIGKRNLQQCADAIIRLRSEYLYSLHKFDAIHFNFTSGHKASYKKWIQGYRPIVRGNKVKWKKIAKRNYSYTNFRKYLDIVFTYAGSYSLGRELHKVDIINNMKIGDVFITPGFPGHAVLVVDMAINKKTGKRLFLLAQSYMPAQDIHVLKNPINSNLNPWYDIDFGKVLYTPEWIFNNTDLKRF